jgi:CheY-like chemotaxis protein
MNACILQIEDDDNDAFFMKHAFKRAGIANIVQVVTDGQMAMDYLAGAGAFGDRTAYPQPDLVLLDLKLPKMSGLEVLEWIRGQPGLRTLVVIVLTSSPDARDARRAYELGANSYVIKPADLQKYAEFARRLKEWWLDCNQFVAVDDAGGVRLNQSSI